MSASANPTGFKPAYNPIGLDRGKLYTIASGYATNIFKGSPVLLASTGVLNIGGATGDILGIFAGVEYTDNGSGKRVVSDFWPASQAVQSGSVTNAYVWDDPSNVYDVQANGSVAQTAIGSQANCINPTLGSTSTGLSTAALDTAGTLTNSGQAQFRIVGFNLDLSNAIGDAFTVVQVAIAQHQFIANKVAV